MMGRVQGTRRVTLELSQTFLECSAYCSTTGRMLVVTIRWARLKLWSISEHREDVDKLTDGGEYLGGSR